ncbi:hypothetical protein PIROE2DRAFT_16749 [Piromyces sp. E2]|nr:hypothetical protein PIROE2DRAFT_16749 [Piromyces sp. E2]|eukprot:OUM58081.1 hypothetical protein PIROE2DRAFT_16749 [Piromyces sp. E2]
MKFITIITTICSSLLVLVNAITFDEPKINNKAILSNITNDRIYEIMSNSNNDEFELNKRGSGDIFDYLLGFCPAGHPACENIVYCNYCKAIVPLCKSKDYIKKYGSICNCMKNYSKDHWKCHKDCYS